MSKVTNLRCGCGRFTRRIYRGSPCCGICKRIELANDAHYLSFADRGMVIADATARNNHFRVQCQPHLFHVAVSTAVHRRLPFALDYERGIR
jgi:hypothetical protein